MPSYVFVSLRQNPFDTDHFPTDYDAHYMWELSRVGSTWVVSSGFDYLKVMLLMKHFGVNRPSQVVGKIFESERDDTCSALDLLLTQIAHGGNYTPPSAKAIRDRALLALADMRCPDYSDLDDETVYHAFAEAWNGFEADEDWFADFTAKIQALGGVQLRKADPKTFSTHVRGPAMYLEIVKGSTVYKLILGPYSTPITFD